MAIPKPTTPVREVIEDHCEAFNSFENFTRMHIFVHSHEFLDEEQSHAYLLVREILKTKYNNRDSVLNIVDMLAYFSRKKLIITELMCRKLINKFEYEEIGKTYFEIKNGSLPWVNADALRAAAIQKKDAGALKRPGAWPN